ncbi:hypothetical protein [Rubricoccus marinus]|uniref:Copper resistance protein D domain-containing protein n=1 Tax=Rubricoccus marinus TaxID=716817 RepID=A0A259U0U4_9BACT|nr:hypothetical protein [Rubricoccus marinus]OZC03467.1 hypothetical protein BSZ36_11030 [Rubricoccus marinus]
MSLVHTFAIALHILFAAAWFGLGLALPSLARAAASGGAPQAGRVITMMNASIVLFYGFAVLNWVLGMRLGFELQYNLWPYHTSMTLGLVLVLVQLFVIRPGWNALVAGDVEKGRKRIGMGIGIGHAVWLGIFVLMYIGRGVVGA